MNEKLIQQSNSGQQWYILEQINGVWKIDKVFYSKERCEEYLKIENIVDQSSFVA